MEWSGYYYNNQYHKVVFLYGSQHLEIHEVLELKPFYKTYVLPKPEWRGDNTSPSLSAQFVQFERENYILHTYNINYEVIDCNTTKINYLHFYVLEGEKFNTDYNQYLIDNSTILHKYDFSTYNMKREMIDDTKEPIKPIKKRFSLPKHLFEI